MLHRLSQKPLLRSRYSAKWPNHSPYHCPRRNSAHCASEERGHEGRRSREEKMTTKAPTPKLQAPEKLQVSNIGNFMAWSLMFLWCLGFGAWSSSAAPALTDLQCYPTNINLSSANSTQRLVVQATYADG